MPEKQRELSLFESGLAGKPNVKRVQMRNFKLAHTVLVDVEAGSILNLHGPEMNKYPADQQIAVPNDAWLERLLYAMNQLNNLRERQERERRHLEEMVNEILDESVRLTGFDLPKRVKEARAEIVEVVEPPPAPWEDENDVPF